MLSRIKHFSEGDQEKVFNKRFVWNHFLLQPLRKAVSTNEWILPVIHGYFNQTRTSTYTLWALLKKMAFHSNKNHQLSILENLTRKFARDTIMITSVQHCIKFIYLGLYFFRVFCFWAHCKHKPYSQTLSLLCWCEVSQTRYH